MDTDSQVRPVIVGLWYVSFLHCCNIAPSLYSLFFTNSPFPSLPSSSLPPSLPPSLLPSFSLPPPLSFPPPLHRGLHGESLLILSICHQLESVVDHLCEMGVDLNTVDQEGNGPLWVALRSRQENIAAKLVSKPASQPGSRATSGAVHIIIYTCSNLVHKSAASTSQHIV